MKGLNRTMVKVSVIIPVYNGEKHLEQCLNSVVNQTLEDIEIICVDDGSTDSSYSILEKYQAADQRVQLFKQQNQYAGAARNLGKANARGDYLVFWDCDDFFELTALEKMYNQIVKTDADICVCGANRYYQNLDKIYPWSGYMKKNKIPNEEVFNRLSNEKYILNFTNEAAWNKMFKRSFVEVHALDFQCIRNGNDIYFTLNAICMAEKITCIEEPLVNYRKNQENSLVGTLSKSAKTPFQAWIDVAENLQKNDIFPEQSFVNKCCSTILYLLRNIYDRNAFYDAVDFLKEYGLEKLCLKGHEEEFFYNRMYVDFLRHLINDTAEDFKDYLMFLTYIQLTDALATKQLKNEKIKYYKRKVSELENEIDKIQKDKWYNLGRTIKHIIYRSDLSK